MNGIYIYEWDRMGYLYIYIHICLVGGDWNIHILYGIPTIMGKYNQWYTNYMVYQLYICSIQLGMS